MTTTTHTSLRRLRPAGMLIAACALLAACQGDRHDKPPRQFFPDMDDSPKWHPQSKSGFFTDSRTMRKPVRGTVPFGRLNMGSAEAWDAEWAAPYRLQRTDLLREDAALYKATKPDGSFVSVIPVEVTPELLRRGQDRFNIYCSVCHGYTGNGKGMVGNSETAWGWSYALPSFHDEKYKKPDPTNPASQIHKDGYIFNVARVGMFDVNGVQKMPGYAHALSERDTWAVVAYIRALQESRAGKFGDRSEAEREVLDRSRPSVPPPPAAPTAPAGAGGAS